MVNVLELGNLILYLAEVFKFCKLIVLEIKESGDKVKTRNILSMVIISSVLIVGNSIAQQKFGYVDSQKILASYKGAQDVQKQLDAKNQEWQQELQDMQTVMQERNKQLEQQGLMLSASRKTELQREIQTMYDSYQKFQNQKWGQNGDAFKLQNELLKPVFDVINKVIKDIGKAENFDFIFDSVAGNILYASDKQPDLTDKVIEELNKSITE